ncbi:MAG: hypothetical protein M3T56_09410 [Chloroflexota bacterium]|nr:hypothetical protein [Chloroflexota bacterium]
MAGGSLNEDLAKRIMRDHPDVFYEVAYTALAADDIERALDVLESAPTDNFPRPDDGRPRAHEVS